MAEFGNVLALGTEGSNVQVEVEMLDYSYVEKCNDRAKLVAILDVLKSGKEGYYPDLIRATEDKLLNVLPEKEKKKYLSMNSTPSNGEIAFAEEELLKWQNEVSLIEEKWKENIGDKKLKHTAPIRGNVKIPKPIGNNSEILQAAKESNKNSMVDDNLIERSSTKKQSDIESIASFSKYWIYLNKVQRNKIEGFRASLNISNFTNQQRKRLANLERIKGNESFRAGDNDDAVQCYSRSIAYDDKNAVVFSNRAMAYIRKDLFEFAEDDCTISLMIDPEFPKTYSRRGLVRFKRGKYLEAAKDFNAAISRDPNNEELKKLLQNSKSKYAEMEGKEMLLGDEQPTNPSEEFVSARFSVVIQKVDSVQQMVLSPFFADAGLIELMHGEMEEVIEESEASESEGYVRIQVITEDDEDEYEDQADETIFHRIPIEEEEEDEGENKDSDEPIEDEVKVEPVPIDTASIQERLYEYKEEGNRLMKIGLFQEAIEQYNRCLELDSRYVAALSNRSLAFLQLKAYDLSIDDCNEVINCEPDNVKAFYRKASALEGLNQYEQSLQNIEIVLSMEPKHEQALKLKARLVNYLSKRENETALAAKDGKDVEPTSVEMNAETVKKQAMHSLSQGKAKEAITLLESFNKTLTGQESMQILPDDRMSILQLLMAAYQSEQLHEMVIQTAGIILKDFDHGNRKAMLKRSEAILKVLTSKGLQAEQGKKKEWLRMAKDDMTSVLQLNPSDAEAIRIIDELQRIYESNPSSFDLIFASKPPSDGPSVRTTADKAADRDQNIREKSDALKEKGNQAIAKQDYLSAVQFYTKSIEMDPSNILALNNRSLGWLKLSRFLDAEHDADEVLHQIEALLKDSDNQDQEALMGLKVKALFRRGQARLSLGKSDDLKTKEAVKDFELILSLDVGNKTAAVELKKAQQQLSSQSIRLQPSPSTSKSNLLKSMESSPLATAPISTTPLLVERTTRKINTKSENKTPEIESNFSKALDINSNLDSKDNPTPAKDNKTSQPGVKDITPVKSAASKIANSFIIPYEPPKTTYELERVWRGLKERPHLFAKYVSTFKKSTYRKVMKESVSPDLISSFFVGLKDHTPKTKHVILSLEGFSNSPSFSLIINLLPEADLKCIRLIFERLSEELDSSDEILKVVSMSFRNKSIPCIDLDKPYTLQDCFRSFVQDRNEYDSKVSFSYTYRHKLMLFEAFGIPLQALTFTSIIELLSKYLHFLYMESALDSAVQRISVSDRRKLSNRIEEICIILIQVVRLKHTKMGHNNSTLLSRDYLSTWDSKCTETICAAILPCHPFNSWKRIIGTILKNEIIVLKYGLKNAGILFDIRNSMSELSNMLSSDLNQIFHLVQNSTEKQSNLSPYLSIPHVVIDVTMGWTLLHYATTVFIRAINDRTFHPMVHMLINAGADVAARDVLGMTPIHTAVKHMNCAAICSLISNNFQLIFSRNVNGLTPLELFIEVLDLSSSKIQNQISEDELLTILWNLIPETNLNSLLHTHITNTSDPILIIDTPPSKSLLERLIANTTHYVASTILQKVSIFVNLRNSGHREILERLILHCIRRNKLHILSSTINQFQYFSISLDCKLDDADDRVNHHEACQRMDFLNTCISLAIIRDVDTNMLKYLLQKYQAIIGPLTLDYVLDHPNKKIHRVGFLFIAILHGSIDIINNISEILMKSTFNDLCFYAFKSNNSDDPCSTSSTREKNDLPLPSQKHLLELFHHPLIDNDGQPSILSVLEALNSLSLSCLFNRSDVLLKILSKLDTVPNETNTIQRKLSLWVEPVRCCLMGRSAECLQKILDFVGYRVVCEIILQDNMFQSFIQGIFQASISFVYEGILSRIVRRNQTSPSLHNNVSSNATIQCLKIFIKVIFFAPKSIEVKQKSQWIECTQKSRLVPKLSRLFILQLNELKQLNEVLDSKFIQNQFVMDSSTTTENMYQQLVNRYDVTSDPYLKAMQKYHQSKTNWQRIKDMMNSNYFITSLRLLLSKQLKPDKDWLRVGYCIAKLMELKQSTTTTTTTKTLRQQGNTLTLKHWKEFLKVLSSELPNGTNHKVSNRDLSTNPFNGYLRLVGKKSTISCAFTNKLLNYSNSLTTDSSRLKCQDSSELIYRPSMEQLVDLQYAMKNNSIVIQLDGKSTANEPPYMKNTHSTLMNSTRIRYLFNTFTFYLLTLLDDGVLYHQEQSQPSNIPYCSSTVSKNHPPTTSSDLFELLELIESKIWVNSCYHYLQIPLGSDSLQIAEANLRCYPCNVLTPIIFGDCHPTVLLKLNGELTVDQVVSSLLKHVIHSGIVKSNESQLALGNFSNLHQRYQPIDRIKEFEEIICCLLRSNRALGYTNDSLIGCILPLAAMNLWKCVDEILDISDENKVIIGDSIDTNEEFIGKNSFYRAWYIWLSYPISSILVQSIDLNPNSTQDYMDAYLQLLFNQMIGGECMQPDNNVKHASDTPSSHCITLTPLHFAVSYERYDCITRLVKTFPDWNVDYKGLVTFAISLGRFAAVSLIRSISSEATLPILKYSYDYSSTLSYINQSMLQARKAPEYLGSIFPDQNVRCVFFPWLTHNVPSIRQSQPQNSPKPLSEPVFIILDQLIISRSRYPPFVRLIDLLDNPLLLLRCSPSPINARITRKLSHQLVIASEPLSLDSKGRSNLYNAIFYGDNVTALSHQTELKKFIDKQPFDIVDLYLKQNCSTSLIKGQIQPWNERLIEMITSQQSKFQKLFHLFTAPEYDSMKIYARNDAINQLKGFHNDDYRKKLRMDIIQNRLYGENQTKNIMEYTSLILSHSEWIWKKIQSDLSYGPLFLKLCNLNLSSGLEVINQVKKILLVLGIPYSQLLGQSIDGYINDLTPSTFRKKFPKQTIDRLQAILQDSYHRRNHENCNSINKSSMKLEETLFRYRLLSKSSWVEVGLSPFQESPPSPSPMFQHYEHPLSTEVMDYYLRKSGNNQLHSLPASLQMVWYQQLNNFIVNENVLTIDTSTVIDNRSKRKESQQAQNYAEYHRREVYLRLFLIALPFDPILLPQVIRFGYDIMDFARALCLTSTLLVVTQTNREACVPISVYNHQENCSLEANSVSSAQPPHLLDIQYSEFKKIEMKTATLSKVIQESPRDGLEMIRSGGIQSRIQCCDLINFKAFTVFLTHVEVNDKDLYSLRNLLMEGMEAVLLDTGHQVLGEFVTKFRKLHYTAYPKDQQAMAFTQKQKLSLHENTSWQEVLGHLKAFRIKDFLSGSIPLRNGLIPFENLNKFKKLKADDLERFLHQLEPKGEASNSLQTLEWMIANKTYPPEIEPMMQYMSTQQKERAGVLEDYSSFLSMASNGSSITSLRGQCLETCKCLTWLINTAINLSCQSNDKTASSGRKAFTRNDLIDLYQDDIHVLLIKSKRYNPFCGIAMNLSDYFPVIQRIYSNFSNENISTTSSRSKVNASTPSNELKIIKSLTKLHHPFSCFESDSFGRYPLILAAITGKVHLVEFMLRYWDRSSSEGIQSDVQISNLIWHVLMESVVQSLKSDGQRGIDHQSIKESYQQIVLQLLKAGFAASCPISSTSPPLLTCTQLALMVQMPSEIVSMLYQPLSIKTNLPDNETSPSIELSSPSLSNAHCASIEVICILKNYSKETLQCMLNHHIPSISSSIIDEMLFIEQLVQSTPSSIVVISDVDYHADFMMKMLNVNQMDEEDLHQMISSFCMKMKISNPETLFGPYHVIDKDDGLVNCCVAHHQKVHWQNYQSTHIRMKMKESLQNHIQFRLLQCIQSQGLLTCQPFWEVLVASSSNEFVQLFFNRMDRVRLPFFMAILKQYQNSYPFNPPTVPFDLVNVISYLTFQATISDAWSALHAIDLFLTDIKFGEELQTNELFQSEQLDQTTFNKLRSIYDQKINVFLDMKVGSKQYELTRLVEVSTPFEVAVRFAATGCVDYYIVHHPAQHIQWSVVLASICHGWNREEVSLRILQYAMSTLQSDAKEIFETLLIWNNEPLLHICCRMGFISIVTYLISIGARPMQIDDSNKNAIDYSIACGQSQVSKLLYPYCGTYLKRAIHLLQFSIRKFLLTVRRKKFASRMIAYDD